MARPRRTKRAAVVWTAGCSLIIGCGEPAAPAARSPVVAGDSTEAQAAAARAAEIRKADRAAEARALSGKPLDD
jgi:hypothetical protein